MFAEATLKGVVDERIWRYDNATFFRLKVSARSRHQADSLFTVALPKNVSRSMPRSLRPGISVSVSTMPRLREMDETLATFIKNAAGEPPQLNGFDATQLHVRRLQTDFVAKAIFILDEPDAAQATATLSGIVDQRIWIYEDMLHFRLRVLHRPEDTDTGRPEMSFFTIVVPRGTTKAMPQRLEAGDRAVVEATLQQREHTETLATFLSNAVGDKPDLGDYDATQLRVPRTKIDFVVTTMIVRPAVEVVTAAAAVAAGPDSQEEAVVSA